GWGEDERGFDEYMKASIGQAGPVYKSRAENPYWKSDPNFQGMLQNLLRGIWPGYPGPFTAAAVEVQAQYVLCDMAGRVVVGGLSADAALKGAHARVGEISKIRGKGSPGAGRGAVDADHRRAAARPRRRRRGRGPAAAARASALARPRLPAGLPVRPAGGGARPAARRVPVLLRGVPQHDAQVRRRAPGVRRLRELRQAHLRRVLP